MYQGPFRFFIGRGAREEEPEDVEKPTARDTYTILSTG